MLILAWTYLKAMQLEILMCFLASYDQLMPMIRRVATWIVQLSDWLNFMTSHSSVKFNHYSWNVVFVHLTSSEVQPQDFYNVSHRSIDKLLRYINVQSKHNLFSFENCKGFWETCSFIDIVAYYRINLFWWWTFIFLPSWISPVPDYCVRSLVCCVPFLLITFHPFCLFAAVSFALRFRIHNLLFSKCICCASSLSIARLPMLYIV